MDITSAFIVYLIIFRLAMILAGTVCIVLGYRLFVRGVWPGNTEISAEVYKSQFTVKNAAPGTCFSLFGALIIGIMFIKGGPELTIGLLQDVSSGVIVADNTYQESENGPGGIVTAEGLKMRGEGVTIDEITKRGLQFERQRDTTKAIEVYKEAVSMMAEPVNLLAWMYYKQNRNDEALGLSQVAVKLAPDDANALDTMAEILYKRGDFAEALNYMEQAASLSGSYRTKLERFKNAAQ